MLAYVVQTNHPRPLAFIEMAVHRIARHFCKFHFGICLSEYRVTQGSRGVAAFGGFLNDKDDFFHALTLLVCRHHSTPLAATMVQNFDYGKVLTTNSD